MMTEQIEISNVAKETIELLSYFDTKIEKIWNENEFSYQQKLREKYNYEDIFKKKIQDDQKTFAKENVHLVIYQKDSFWTRLFTTIKKLFKRDRY